MSIMEEVFLRFQHIGEQIFDHLDNVNLTKCMEVNYTWKEFINNQKSSWIRIIEKYVTSLKTELWLNSLEWQTFLKTSNVEILKEMARTINNYQPDVFFPNKGNPLIYAAMSGNAEIVAKLLCEENSKQPEDEFGRTPLHYAARYGHLDLCQLIYIYFGVVDPKDKDGRTPLHHAAGHGHLETCDFLIKTMKEDNHKGLFLSVDLLGENPLTLAAKFQNLKTCELIINNLNRPSLGELFGTRLIDEDFDDPNSMKFIRTIVDIIKDKNPKEDCGVTLLHGAAENGLWEICHLIVKNVDDKNPKDENGMTPLHLAADAGFFHICILISENVEDKNPKCSSRFTPLHFAAKNGHLSICRYIMNNVADKNPKNVQGLTPFHVAAKNGHFEVCKWFTEILVNKNPNV